MDQSLHKAGFVNIIGNPNVGKSTLLNDLIKQKLSIVSPKAQTTRHRILGIVTSHSYQIVFSDTPGIVLPHYKLHENMMEFVHTSLADADIILSVTDIYETDIKNPELYQKLLNSPVPVIHLINKVDLLKTAEEAEEKRKYWQEKLPNAEVRLISALHKVNTLKLLERIVELLPLCPPYFPDGDVTDKTERFFVSEIIRGRIFEYYQQEIPYSCEVVVDSFKDKENIIAINAIIYVERDSQKGILIGNKGEKIKKLGTESRLDIEDFLEKKVFLELSVKVLKDWRNNVNVLKKLGY